MDSFSQQKKCTTKNKQNISDEGLLLACRLPSLTCLNASRCHGITAEGLAGLAQAADRLKRLNLGWCMGLSVFRAEGEAPSPFEGEDRDGGDADENEHHGGGEESDGDGDGGGEEMRDEGDVGGEGVGEGERHGGRMDVDGEGEGEGERHDARRGARRRRRVEWELPVLPELEWLCLARLVVLVLSGCSAVALRAGWDLRVRLELCSLSYPRLAKCELSRTARCAFVVW